MPGANPLSVRLTPRRSLRAALGNFWDEITAHASLWPSALCGALAAGQQKASELIALMFGSPPFSPHARCTTGFHRASSSVTTTPLPSRGRWSDCDFDRNQQRRRNALERGAVNVRTGLQVCEHGVQRLIRCGDGLGGVALGTGCHPHYRLDRRLPIGRRHKRRYSKRCYENPGNKTRSFSV